MYRISQNADWRKARFDINRSIAVGIDLNNSITPSAVITDINSDGFIINLGGLRNIKLKWSLVEYCWRELCHDGLYGQNIYDNPFGKAFLDSDCLDFIIRRLFSRSGLLESANSDQMQIDF